ncbi:MAG: hypothetical protein HYX32_04645 [Actinobacteria bacterium]|nr:hypothetical protein [Actinomycetota bacterium]
MSTYDAAGSTLVYRIELAAGRSEAVFRFSHHVGALVVASANVLVACGWGGRALWRLSPSGEVLDERRNPNHFVDYRDGTVVDGCVVVAGTGQLRDADDGLLVGAIGGLGVLDPATLDVLAEVPVSLWQRSGRPVTASPAHVRLVDPGATEAGSPAGEGAVDLCDGRRLELLAIPDDRNATLVKATARLDP